VGESFFAHRVANPDSPALAALAKMADEAVSPKKRAASAAGDANAERIGRVILASGERSLPFEVKASEMERSGRECVVRKPMEAWRAYRSMLLWFAAREVVAAAAGGEAAGSAAAAGGDLWERLEAALTPDDACRVGVEWENLGGLLAPAPRLESILGKASAGAYTTWNEFHAEYRDLSARYPADKARYAWSLLGALYPTDSPLAGKPVRTSEDERHFEKGGPSKEGLRAALADLDALYPFVADELLASRVKDWSNTFRKATFRSEAEMMAVLGDPAQNSFIQRTRKELDEARRTAAELAEKL
jgi:hypothetical protein